MTGFHYHYHHHGHGIDEEYERKMPDRVLLSRLLKHILPYRKRLAIVMTAIMATTITGLIQPKIMQIAIDEYIFQGNFEGLSSLSLAFITLLLVNWISSYLQTYHLGWMGQNMLYEMRKRLFAHLQKLSFSFYDRSETGDIVSRVTNDTDSIGEMFVREFVDVISQSLILVGVLIMMFWMSIPLALASIIVVPLLVVSALVFQSKFRAAYRATREKISGVTSRLQEGISGIREIQSFTREEDTKEDFRQANIENLQANLQATKVWGTFSPTVQMISAIGMAVIYLYGGMLAINGVVTVGTLFAFIYYVQMFFRPIFTLTNFYNTVQSAFAAAERIYEIEDTIPQIKDEPDAVELPPLKGEVKFEDVTFGYDPDHPILYNISFHAQPKETVALAGPTGAGKSTIIKLLSRFYENQSGTIEVDGYDIRGVTLDSIHRQMGIVLQETFLFSGTIKENIRYGKLEATDEEIGNAAKMIGAHDFIMQLPEGYNTEIGERGAGLSVGQKQLVSFARALLRDPAILILDEATSSIDPYTDLLIRRAMRILFRNRTSIIIAHRLSTIREADKILVVDDGRIVERGKHRELMRKKDGLYRHFYVMQFKEPVKAAARSEFAPQIVQTGIAAKNPAMDPVDPKRDESSLKGKSKE
ncbi:MAG: ABC transporter ATP-binding protein/permease [Candidatus Bathyarchaeota archaeon]|nr:ABC transporter ATP-binding protein/permease [Candidatus Bathyarchaeota archaeon]